MAQLWLAIRILLMGISFMGLCGLVRRWFRLDGSAAPLVACSLVIAALTLAGIIDGAIRPGSASILLVGWWALFAGGLAGFAWRYVVRRAKPDPVPLVLMVLAVAYAFVRFRGAYFAGNDSVSHWGLAAKYLLRTNRFPDSSTELIYFPSYPLGTATFIYYLCRFTVSPTAAFPCAGAFLGAQCLLGIAALAPLAGLVRRERKLGFAVTLVMIAFLLMCNIYATTLQVDALMAYMGIGAAAIAAANFDRPREVARALACVAMALALVKSAGLFFSVLCMALAIWSAVAAGDRPAKRALGTALLFVLCIAAAFFGWQIHYKSAYAGAPTGKHAVSLSGYAAELASKPPELVRGILTQLLRRPFQTDKTFIVIAVLAAAFAVALLGGADRRRWIRRWLGMLALSVVTYVAWFAMLFLMYLFSMPAAEAARLASIDRYEESATILITGLAIIYILARLFDPGYALPPLVKGLGWTGVAAFVLFMALAPRLGVTHLPERVIGGDTSGGAEYASVQKIRRENDVPEGGRYVVFADDRLREPLRTYYLTKYEFFSNDITMILAHADAQSDADRYAVLSDVHIDRSTTTPVDDLRAAIVENVDGCDCVIVYDEDAGFDAALRELLADGAVDVPVLFGY